MPAAHGGASKKYWLMDHDAAAIFENPPEKDTWYEVFHAYDVRLIWCVVLQSNQETNSHNLEVRWTIDGNVYLDQFSAGNNVAYYIFRNYNPSLGGTLGLEADDEPKNAAFYVDKRGLDFKVEVRDTDANDTNQILQASCVYETLEET